MNHLLLCDSKIRMDVKKFINLRKYEAINTALRLLSDFFFLQLLGKTHDFVIILLDDLYKYLKAKLKTSHQFKKEKLSCR